MYSTHVQYSLKEQLQTDASKQDQKKNTSAVLAPPICAEGVIHAT